MKNQNQKAEQGTETVYFRRSPSESEDRLTVPAGTATQHVRAELITRIVQDQDQKAHVAPASEKARAEQGAGLTDAEFERDLFVADTRLSSRIAAGQSADWRDMSMRADAWSRLVHRECMRRYLAALPQSEGLKP